MASVIPKEFKKEIIDVLTGAATMTAEVTWKVALFTNAYSTASILYSVVNEVSGGGYTAGGATLSGRTSGYVDTNNRYLDAADTQWTAATFTARYAVVYETVGGKIRFIYDFLADYPVAGGTFTIQWNSGGLVKIS